MNSMFNLPFGTSRNRRLLTSSTSGSGPDLAPSDGQPATKQATGNKGGWFRSTSSIAGASVGVRNHTQPTHRSKTASCDGSDFDFDVDEHDVGVDHDEISCDPLMYRLQHQKQFMAEKETQRQRQRQRRRGSNSSRSRRGSGSGSSQHRRCVSDQNHATTSNNIKERDPFDLWGSLTSEEESSHRRSSSQHSSNNGEGESNVETVDISGWESRGSNSNTTPSKGSRRRRSSQLSDHSEENENQDACLLVDFGGVTPLQLKNKDPDDNRSRRRSRRMTRSADPEQPCSPSPDHQRGPQHHEDLGINDHPMDMMMNGVRQRKLDYNKYKPKRLKNNNNGTTTSGATASGEVIGSISYLGESESCDNLYLGFPPKKEEDNDVHNHDENVHYGDKEDYENDQILDSESSYLGFPDRDGDYNEDDGRIDSASSYLGFPNRDHDDDGDHDDEPPRRHTHIGLPHNLDTSLLLGFPESSDNHHEELRSSAGHSACPSHADLAMILSDLEKESECLLAEDPSLVTELTKTYDGAQQLQHDQRDMSPEPMKRMSSSMMSCTSSLSSPTELARELYRESIMSRKGEVTPPPPPENGVNLEHHAPRIPDLPYSEVLYDADDQHGKNNESMGRRRSRLPSPNPTRAQGESRASAGQLLQRQVTPPISHETPTQQKQQRGGITPPPQKPRRPLRSRATVTGPPAYLPISTLKTTEQEEEPKQQKEKERRTSDPIPNRRPIEEEEECPRLQQLRQRTTEELRIELHNMQSQSKMNLEKSWAETEKMRVEVCDLDDKVNEIKQKIEEAKEKLLLAGWSLDEINNPSLSSRRQQSSSGANSTMGGSQFISRLIPLSEKLNDNNTTQQQQGGSSSSNRSRGGGKFRRRRTIDAFSVSSTGNNSMIPDALGLASLRRSMVRSNSLEDLQVAGNDNNNFCSPTAAKNALRNKNDRDDSDLRASERSKSGGRRGFLGDLGASIRMKMGSGASVCSADFDLGFDVDGDDDGGGGGSCCSSEDGPPTIADDSSRKPEFNDQIYKSLLAGEPTSVPTSFPYDSDDDSSDAISGVFYPAPHVEGSSRDGSRKSLCSEVDFSGDDSSDAKSGVFYLPETSRRHSHNSRAHSFVSNLSSDPTDGENSDALQNGVYYNPAAPAAAGSDNDNDDKSHCSLSLAGLEMDDFDFDPFKTVDDKSEDNIDVAVVPTIQPINESGGGSSKPKPDRRKSGFVRRPSFMSLFDAKLGEDDSSSSSSDDDDSQAGIPSTSYHTAPAVSLHMRSLQKERDDEDERSKIVKEIILERKKEIEQLTKTVHAQEEEIKTCEIDISKASANRETKQKEIDEMETRLRQEIDELSEEDKGIESRMDQVEASEQVARDTEQSLQEKLALIIENYSALQEDRSSSSQHHHELEQHELEQQLDTLKERHNACQEDAIGLLSALLTDIDTVRIPSLRDEELLTDSDHSGGSDSGCAVSREVVRKFDALTDKEEELVNALSDPVRIKLCQRSFKQNQENIEKAMHCSAQLSGLESDLRSHLNAVKRLIKYEMGDEGTHTTESSTASEQLSSERVFVETIIGYVEDVKQNQGKRILDALSKNMEFLTHWDQLLLPEDIPSTPTASNCSGGSDLACSSFTDTVSMLDDVVQKAKGELTDVKSHILSEYAKFQARMQSPGHSNNRYLSSSDHTIRLTPNSSESDQREATVYNDAKQLNEQLFQQLSAADQILSERESLSKKYSSNIPTPPQDHRPKNGSNLPIIREIIGEDEDTAKELEELDNQMSIAMGILSERESLRYKYSSDLRVMQAQAQEESSTNIQLMNEIQMKIKHILSKLEREEELMESLERSLKLKKEEVGQLEYRLLTLPSKKDGPTG